ncbi:hypothetical protein DRO69_09215 [Candidatus Bathyarchaeota archaeon]|nr:MAG: hypothetical protein DRO69_09215 [Candidatus Bathyarchaeota archaeon]
MPKISHVREEVWDEATREFRFKSLPTVPDIELSILRNNLSVASGGATTLGSLEIPIGSVLRVTLLRYLTNDSRGAIFAVVQNSGTIDHLYLPSPGETLVTESKEKPIYVLEGTVELQLLALLGSISTGTIYGMTLHGYYSKQESLNQIT